jgi:hypothetical protein
MNLACFNGGSTWLLAILGTAVAPFAMAAISYDAPVRSVRAFAQAFTREALDPVVDEQIFTISTPGPVSIAGSAAAHQETGDPPFVLIDDAMATSSLTSNLAATGLSASANLACQADSYWGDARALATAQVLTSVTVDEPTLVSFSGEVSAKCHYHLGNESRYSVALRFMGPGVSIDLTRVGSIITEPDLGFDINISDSFTGVLQPGTPYTVEAMVQIWQNDESIGTRPLSIGAISMALVVLPEPGILGLVPLLLMTSGRGRGRHAR